MQAIDTQNAPYLLAIESGGSGTRVALADACGRIVSLERCGSGSPLYRNRDDFAAAFRTTLRAAIRATGGDAPAVAVVGLAGPADRELIIEEIGHVLHGVDVLEFSEGDLARGLHGVSCGVALVSGTGCSCSAINEAGELTSFGGFGPQFGDEGSGYWIGCEALKAAFLAEQGRIAPTTLLDAARAFYAVESPWGIHQEAEGSGHVPAPRVAAFAVQVNNTAEAGDHRAGAILDEAGALLARLILETADRAKFTTRPVPLVMTGGALRADRVMDALLRTLAEGPVEFKVYPVAHDPIGGLIRLLQLQHETRNG